LRYYTISVQTAADFYVDVDFYVEHDDDDSGGGNHVKI